METRLDYVYKPEEEKVPTLSEVKAYRKLYVTRQLPTVVLCQHRIDPEEMPHNKCDACWWTFFNQDAENVQHLHTYYKNDKQSMTAKYGTLFVKQFCRFMSAVVKMKEKEV